MHNLLVAAQRTFPIDPTSTRDLQLGDLIAVPLPEGGWGCLQVTGLRSSGPGSRTTFMAAVRAWQGESPPDAAAIDGSAFIEHGLVPIELFTAGGLRVTGTGAVPVQELDTRTELQVGTRQKVWGWRAAIRHVELAQS